MNLNSLKSYYTKLPVWIKKIYGAIPWDLRMGREYRKTMRFLDESLHWSREQWFSYQSDRLRELMRHCEKHVPYYTNLFPRIGINTDGADIWSEFRKIPMIDKSIVTQSLDLFIAQDKNKKGYYSATTGGTTGKPMKTVYDSKSYGKEWAYIIFFWRLAIGYFPKDRKATFRGVSFGSSFYLENPIYNEIYFSPFHLTSDNIEKVVSKLLYYNPKYIYGYPSAIEQLGKYFLAKSIKVKKLKGIILISENIYEDQKRSIESAFNCKIYSFYGHSERLIFASMGPELDGYYAHPAYGITELIDEDGKSVADCDQIGELVGTGFINQAMPLLRFRTGDYSCWVETRSKINMPILGEIKGRWKQEYLIGREGTKISLTSLNMHSDVYSKIRQLQYVQNNPGIIQIKIVKEDSYTSDDELLIIKEHLNKLGKEFEVKISYVSALEKTKAGKARYLVQNFDGQSL